MSNLGPTDVAGNVAPIRRFRATASDKLKAMTNLILAERPTVDPKEITELNQDTPPSLNRTLTNVAEAGSEIGEEDTDRENSLAKAQRLFNVPLSNAKRQAAVGKRGLAEDQKIVMVNNTASQASTPAPGNTTQC